MDINQLASQTGVADGIKKHPFGDFQGTISMVTAKSTSTGKRYFEIKIRTEHGEVYHNIFDFDNSDIQKLYSDPSYKQKVMNKIGFVKRVFVDLGIVNERDAAGMGWSQGAVSVVGLMPALKGQACTVSVQQNDQGGYPRTYINAPQLSSPMMNMDHTNRPSQQYQAQEQRPAPSQRTSEPPKDWQQNNQWSGDSMPNLDQVPF